MSLRSSNIGFNRKSNKAKHVKNDEGKPKFSLVPPRALRVIAEALTYGEEKYPGNDFRKVENGFQRYDDAARRHQNAMDCGEAVDEESGHLHLAHEIVNKLFMLEILLLSLEQQQDDDDE